MSIKIDMKQAEQRRFNARKLLAQCETNREFAAQCGLKGAQITQLLGEHHVCNIGDVIARRIEIGFNKPEYWLDMDHDADFGGQESLTMELMLDSVAALNAVLKKNKIAVNSVDPILYSDTLRHILCTALTIGKVSTSQVQSTLTLSGISKTAR